MKAGVRKNGDFYHTILVFPHQTGWRYSDGIMGKNDAFSTNILLYLRNAATESHSYYGKRTGNRTNARTLQTDITRFVSDS